MNPEILAAINILCDTLKEHAPKDAVSFSLFINVQGPQTEFDLRPADRLKMAGVSMRNLAGEWIK